MIVINGHNTKSTEINKRDTSSLWKIINQIISLKNVKTNNNLVKCMLLKVKVHKVYRPLGTCAINVSQR